MWSIEAGRNLTLTATEADTAVTFSWDFADGTVLEGRTVSHAYGTVGTKRITLTATAPADGTVTAGTATGNVSINVLPPNFQAIMIPGAGSICEKDESGACKSDSPTWATDLSITNPGTTSTTVTLYFASFTDEIPSDLSTLPFDSLKSVRLDAGQSWSGVDVVGDPDLLDRRGAGKGILFARFEGGNRVPIVTTRVYFTNQGSSYGTALPSFVTGPYGQTAEAVTTAAESTTGQTLIGLRNDSLYRFNVSLFNASSDAGAFHIDAFTEDGEQVASRDFNVLPYDQAGVNDTDIIPNIDSSKRYVIRATSTSGMLQAYASVLDRRNNDLVQVSDDTPRIDVPPDTQVNYYISGVGRIEIPESNTHWRTDLRFFNPSSLPRKPDPRVPLHSGRQH